MGKIILLLLVSFTSYGNDFNICKQTIENYFKALKNGDQTLYESTMTSEFAIKIGDKMEREYFVLSMKNELKNIKQGKIFEKQGEKNGGFYQYETIHTQTKKITPAGESWFYLKFINKKCLISNMMSDF